MNTYIHTLVTEIFKLNTFHLNRIAWKSQFTHLNFLYITAFLKFLDGMFAPVDEMQEHLKEIFIG
jgi:hypothetical protein